MVIPDPDQALVGDVIAKVKKANLPIDEAVDLALHLFVRPPTFLADDGPSSWQKLCSPTSQVEYTPSSRPDIPTPPAPPSHMAIVLSRSSSPMVSAKTEYA